MKYTKCHPIKSPSKRVEHRRTHVQQIGTQPKKRQVLEYKITKPWIVGTTQSRL
jgi:hypothetical protein